MKEKAIPINTLWRDTFKAINVRGVYGGPFLTVLLSRGEEMGSILNLLQYAGLQACRLEICPGKNTCRVEGEGI